MIKKSHMILTALAVAAIATGGARADAPSGYYDSCSGKSGAALLKALQDVIGNHTNVGYAGLWELYHTSDVDANGKIWDMYSTKRWGFGEQCGNYSAVGDCFNREHSMPKSWFNDASPMYSDGFHIYPTDGKVNGQRSNYPYGECAGGETLSSSGGVKPLGRLGKCTAPGYSGTVFEPDDQYKGDFARSYFYMAACYNSRIASWNSDMLAGNAFPAFKQWAIDLLMKWHSQDPVSDKELKRNEAVYKQQRNRNPFIDNPEMAEHIWGNQVNAGWQQGGGGTVMTPDPKFTRPTAGSTLSLGNVSVGKTATATVSVSGVDMTQATGVSISGSGFSVAPSSLSAAQVMAGATVNVSLTAQSAGQCRGTLTLTSGSASTYLTITATAIAGLTAGEATGVTSDSFVATWIDNTTSATATYQLHVTLNGEEIAGYPLTVTASHESHEVGGLEPSTTYVYWLTSGSERSNSVSVTTRGLTPELYLEPTSDLAFTTEPGVASAPVTIFLEAYNVDGNISVSVKAPFEVSVDKQQWSQSAILTEDDGQLYLRLNGLTPGVFTTSVAAQAEGCYNDDLMAQGVIKGAEPVKESFEKDVNFGYTGASKSGDACRWDFNDAGVFDDSREVHTGAHGVRFNSAEGGSVTMSEPMSGGLSKVGFYTRLWDADGGEATLRLDYSLDNGASWNTALSVNPGHEWAYHEADMAIEGDYMLRFVKSEGPRVALDDVTLTPMQAELDVTNRISVWDIRAAEGSIVIDNPGETAMDVKIYTLDGVMVWSGSAPGGSSTVVGTGRGHYIAVSGDESRRAVVR